MVVNFVIDKPCNNKDISVCWYSF